MAAATLLIFVAVIHRYGTGVPFLYPYFIQLHISWAQELCIYMFVWMAKFGAAYGVRAGIHVGVDVLINRLPPRLHKSYAPVRPLLGGGLPRDGRHAGGDLRVGHRPHRLGVARPRSAEVDRLSLHSARLVPDVL